MGHANCILGETFLELEPNLCFSGNQYSYVVLNHIFRVTWFYDGTRMLQ